ncbi:acetylornithine transaminase [Bacillus massiliglaciei]|uniref:acetylornithine transaminase n=1 Tax=Bacillus massiliglaciei TaxID=1816693 RepID=UPI000B0E89C5|nr:acetylornithine transaminase [Bacillus massiliglaciei]
MTALFQTYARWDIEPKKAEGAWMTSTEGKKYLDFTSGIGVLNVGHQHPAVKKAVKEQLDSFWHVSNLFKSSGQERVARLLADKTGLSRVFFANSGAEANEAAIKLARKATGRSKIITCTQSFHGRTFATMGATGQDKVKQGFGPMLSSFEYVPFNDVNAIKKAVDTQTAAVMLEIVQGEGGIYVVQQEYLDTIQTICRETGALLIIDEIQTGIGRTGQAFAFQHFQVKPDIVTLAKGLGNGLPIGAMLGSEALADYFGPGSHGSTFGGNPVSVAAAEAVLQIVFEEQFLQKVSEKSAYLFEKLHTAFKESNEVQEIRGIGLMVGIECTSEVSGYVKELQNVGILVLNAGPKVIRLLPPLTAEFTEIDLAVEKISEILKIKETV